MLLFEGGHGEPKAGPSFLLVEAMNLQFSEQACGPAWQFAEYDDARRKGMYDDDPLDRLLSFRTGPSARQRTRQAALRGHEAEKIDPRATAEGALDEVNDAYLGLSERDGAGATPEEIADYALNVMVPARDKYRFVSGWHRSPRQEELDARQTARLEKLVAEQLPPPIPVAGEDEPELAVFLGMDAPAATKGRISELLAKGGQGTLSEEEEAELDHYMELEHQGRMAKARR